MSAEHLEHDENTEQREFRGVGILFNADQFTITHASNPEWVPRQDWEVISPGEIREFPEAKEIRLRWMKEEGLIE